MTRERIVGEGGIAQIGQLYAAALLRLPQFWKAVRALTPDYTRRLDLGLNGHFCAVAPVLSALGKLQS